MKRVITVVLAVALLVALAAPAIADAFTLYATQSGVKVYAKKSTSAKVYRKLSRGEKVLIEKKSGKWYAILVEDPSGDGQTLGWIQAKYLSTTKPSKEKKKAATKAPKATVSPQKEINRVLDTMRSVTPYEAEVVTRTENGTVALRRQPTTNGALIRQIINGSHLQVLAEGDGWNQVSDPQTGSIGYMASKYLVERSQVANDEAEAYESEVDGTQADDAGEGRTVAPIDVSLNVNSLPDGDYPVSFDRGDVASLASGIYMNAVHIYAMDLYPADAIRALAVGDAVVAEGRSIVVNSVELNGDSVEVNGGLDADGGYVFGPQGGGMYRVYGYDDLATYTDLGITTLVLEDNAVFTDASDIDGQPVAVMGEAIVDALHSATLDAFYADNTTVTLKGGKVVRIDRRYVP